MMYVCQLPKEKQKRILEELKKLGLTNEDIERGMSSKVDDLADTIDIKKIVKK